MPHTRSANWQKLLQSKKHPCQPLKNTVAEVDSRKIGNQHNSRENTTRKTKKQICTDPPLHGTDITKTCYLTDKSSEMQTPQAASKNSCIHLLFRHS